MLRAILAVAVVAMLTVACESPNAPPEAAGSRTAPLLNDGVGPLCQLGCTDPDPDPDAFGIFLGEEVTADNCTAAGVWSDVDEDGVADFCETVLAQAFAPELYWSYTYDDVRGEPYWVAGPGGAGSIRVGYLFSYNYDLGSDHGSCNVPVAHYLCLPHTGDSEAVFLDIRWDATSGHWELMQAWYLQHGTHMPLDVGAGGYAHGLSYPSGQGDYPRVFVAEDKHASYPQLSLCNGGGTFGTDTCEHTNRAERVVVSEAYNIGSRLHPFIDCIPSRDSSYEHYGSGRSECFWTRQRFRGWVDPASGGGDAEGYSTILSRGGF